MCRKVHGKELLRLSPMSDIVIANCGGFWGDDPTAARRQVQGGRVDYLVMDYLAEITMAILQKQRVRRPDAGYATDFLTQLGEVLPDCVERGITVISNAGGVNPLACKTAVERLAGELGVADGVRVGAARSAPAGTSPTGTSSSHGRTWASR